MRDLTAGWRGNPPEHVGSVALLDRMHELPNLRLVACGHIHPAYGRVVYREIDVVGGSLVNEEYQVANPPIVVEV
jgi:Icc-related predicted phosphoesterase